MTIRQKVSVTGLGIHFLLQLLLIQGCSKTPNEPSPEARRPVAAASSASEPQKNQIQVAPDPKGVGEPVLAPAPSATEHFKKPAGERIVAIGDLHGDFQATLRAFRLAGAIDAKDEWIGGRLVVVQTGDQLDRGDDEVEILHFLQRIQKSAHDAGGAVYVLNGNHETMNVLGDFRYVTQGALSDFDDFGPASPRAVKIPPPYEGRARALLPGGGAALLLAQRPLILMVGSTAFVHGGILPAHLSYGIDRLNDETAAWMRGERPMPPEPVMDQDGPVWTRLYGDAHLGDAACQVLSKTLEGLGAQRLVVGHTVQDKGMSGACQNRVYRIDVGLSRYYGDHPVQVLEIRETGAQILTEQ